jgi:hypothetical protein
MKNVSEDLIQSVETHLTIGAEPLLTHLIAEVEFTEVGICPEMIRIN